MEKDEIDPRIYDLYDQYCHSTMERREFLKRAAARCVYWHRICRHRRAGSGTLISTGLAYT